MSLQLAQQKVTPPFLDGNDTVLHRLGLLDQMQSQMLGYAVEDTDLHFNAILTQTIIQGIEHLVAKLENLLRVIKSNTTGLGQMKALFAPFKEGLAEVIFKLFQLS
jgi:hypothetical protein